MFERIRHLMKKYRDLSEIADLSDRELADLGVSRDQAMSLASIPEGVAGRVVAMAQVFGLSQDDLMRNRGEWADLIETCNGCTTRSECRSFMAAGRPGGPAAVDFCPNRANFESHPVPG